jgi:hypothetical protein
MTFTPHSPALRRPLAGLLLLSLLTALAPAPLAARGGTDDDDDQRALELRLNDAIGKPGGQVALVIRTYAARPIRQGRITVKVRRPAAAASTFGITADAVTQPARPLTFLRAVVFSATGDAVTTAKASATATDQSVALDFRSAAAGVNATDGPLAVLYFRLDPAVQPGQRWTITVDPATTGIVGPSGAAIPFEPISATLRVRAATAPYAIEAEGDEVEPGETAELGVETKEPFAIKSGRLTLRYDAAAWGRAPQVRIDPRYGRATLRVVRNAPGLLVVTFTSPDASLNSVPGGILSVMLPTSTSVPTGTSGRIWLDPAASWLTAKNGKRLRLAFEANTLDFEAD